MSGRKTKHKRNIVHLQIETTEMFMPLFAHFPTNYHTNLLYIQLLFVHLCSNQSLYPAPRPERMWTGAGLKSLNSKLYGN